MTVERLTLAAAAFFLIACSALPTTTTPPVTTAPPTPTFAPAKLGTTETDVTYCTLDDLPQTMDVYYPASGGPWPVLLYVHGGSWSQGDKAEGFGWANLTAQGYLIVSVNYRLTTGQIKFPAMIEDVKCAVRHLRAHVSDYNIDPEHIGAVGASAGGHLAALLGASDNSAGWEVGQYLDQSSRVQAVLTMSGPSDFALDFPSAIDMSIYFAFGDLAGAESPDLVAASPVTYVTADDPPFLIIHGDQDPLVPVEQSQVLHERLEQAGVSSQLVIIQGGNHSLQGKNTDPSAEQISEIIRDFLEKNLK